MSSISPAEPLFFQADEKIKNGLFSEARELLEQAIAADKSFGRAYNHLGWLYETKYQDYKKAEENYEKALELSPEYPAIYINYAILLSTLDKNNELTKILEKGLKVPGVNKGSMYNEYGILYEKTGEFQKAIDAFEQALLFTMSDQQTDAYKNSIERCKKKAEILKK